MRRKAVVLLLALTLLFLAAAPRSARACPM
jgi:hypothetical protein